MEDLLKVEGLHVSYLARDHHSRVAVAGVSFSVAQGEVLGLMGESGCGKSTLALATMGLLEKTRAKISGSIIFRGANLLNASERVLGKIRGAHISMVHQEPGIALCPVMRVGQQVAEVVRAHKNWSWEKCREAAHAVLSRVGLEPTNRIFSAYPHQLSGGQLQRVALAQAIVCDPELIIADEPTASLDARSRSEFIDLLRDLQQRSRMSMLLISHTPEIQASLANRLMVMRDGRIVEQGAFEELYSTPSDAYTRSLLHRRSGLEEPAVEERVLAHPQAGR